MKVVLITGHDCVSLRKTGFHFWADIASSQGHRVAWITLGQSYLTALRHRNGMPAGPVNQWVDHTPNIKFWRWCPPVHPVKAGPFTQLLAPFFSALCPALVPTGMMREIKDADIIIVETGMGLMLVPRLASACPKARLIYYCSDRLDTLRAHPSIMTAEKTALPYFSLVRTNSPARNADFPSHPNVRYIPQGIDKAQFDRDYPNPYQGSKNIIGVGDMLFDAQAVATMARALPDWQFHLFGRGCALGERLPNVTEYGERAYNDIIPYLKHADIGLAPYRYDNHAAYLGQSSLKIAQYTYCRLPVVAPSFIPAAAHIKSYRPADSQSMVDAVSDAAACNREAIDRRNIPDWTYVYKDMLEGIQ